MIRKLMLFAALQLLATAVFAFEGKWTPQQVLQIDPAFLKQQGLEIDPAQLWDPAKGTGLLAATINTGGCSGGFISPDGLFVTNHHCLFGVLQENSTAENDIITKGFLARSRAEELPSKVLRIQIPRRFTDVTKEILAAVPKKGGDAARLDAINAKSTELVKECEKAPARRCSVAAFDGGVYYILSESIEVSDVRLVWAPPRSIGEYGGEIDNWMWPRHTGDFAIGRIYVAPDGSARTYDKTNVPYKSDLYFPISTKGVDPGDFVMVLGYPGTTYRALTAAEMDERGELYFPKREELYGEWIRMLEESAKGDPAAEITVADHVKTLLNRYKNAQGQIAGLERGRILEKQRETDAQVLAWAKEKSEHKGAVKAYEELQKVVAEQRKSWDRDFLLDHIRMTAQSFPTGPKSLWLSHTLARRAKQRALPDEKRNSEYSERLEARLRARMEREQKSILVPADKKMLQSFVRRALALPAESRIAAIDKRFGGLDDAAVTQKIDEIFAASRVLDVGERMKMFDESVEQLRARKDPLLELGFDIDDAVSESAALQKKWNGAISRLRPEWRKAVMAWAGKPIAPDANSTLRVAFGHVRGYEPRDAVNFTPQTTLRGILQKDKGEEPFDAPEEILAAARARKFGAYEDEHLDDVPVNFLADADTTGGNSGSPTVNGRGELVGVNFDRVWENVANDFGYNPDIARNVNADVRYMLWILDVVQNAEELLRELGVRR